MCWRTVECIGESGVYIVRIKDQIESVSEEECTTRKIEV